MITHEKKPNSIFKTLIDDMAKLLNLMLNTINFFVLFKSKETEETNRSL